jgi:hypothetical protein
MSKSISISLSADDEGAIDALALQAPLANRHALARVAMRLGLKALADEPGRIPELLRGQRVRFCLSH